MALKSPEIDKEEVDEAPWPVVLDALARTWRQGQHITLLGKNGSGKTTTAFQLLELRRYVLVILTKRKDDLFDVARRRGFKMLRAKDERPDPRSHGHIAMHISPEGLTRADAYAQAEQIRQVLDQVWREGGWTVYLDEVATLADQLGLAPDLRQLWKEARSSHISIVAGTQRPARVPIEMYDQPRFLVFWRNNNREALKRLADMHGPDPELVRQVIVQLDRYEILIVDTLTDDLVRSRPPRLSSATASGR